MKWIENIYAAGETLASVCDGAQKQDSCGYNGCDASYARELIFDREHTPFNATILLFMLRKYMLQLSGFGIDWNELRVALPKSDRIKYEKYTAERKRQSELSQHERLEEKLKKELSKATAKIVVKDTAMHITTPYNPQYLSEMKESGVSRYWMPNETCWKHFCKDHGTLFPIIKKYFPNTEFPEIRVLATPVSKDNIQLVGDKYVFAFRYNQTLVSEVKTFKNRKYDPKSKSWTVTPLDVDDLRKIKALAKKYGLDMDSVCVQALNRNIQDWSSSQEMSHEVEGEITIPTIPKGRDLYNFQKVGVNYALNHNGRILLADDMGCIDGYALISVHRAGRGFKIPLYHLYNKFNDINKGWDLNIPTMARSLTPEGEIRLNKIKSVIFKGLKDVLEINTMSGKRLRLTPDHEVKTPCGWTEAKNLKQGDTILTNGIPACILCGSTKNIITSPYAKFKGYCKQCMYRQLRENHANYKLTLRRDGYYYISCGLKYHPQNTTGGIPVQRLVAEANLNSLKLDEWLNKLKTNKLSGCKFIDASLHVHHKDKDKTNNNIDNLEIIDVSKHHKIHNTRLNIASCFFPKEDVVVSVTQYKQQIPVYDIIMEDPSRNFVADGIIVHNCGKTVQAIGYYLHEQDKIKRWLVICPANLKINWKREIEMWTTQVLKIHIASTKDKDWSMFQIVIINYDIITRLKDVIEKWNANYVTLDEAHYIKNNKSQRAKTGKAIAQKAKYCMMLTGTPLMNKPIELWNLIDALYPKMLGTYFQFGKRYCDAHNDGWGWQFKGCTNPEELQNILRQRTMIRRLKTQVLTELPEKTRSVISIELSQESMLRYDKKIKNFYDYCNTEHEHEQDFHVTAIAMLAAARRETALGKVDGIVAWVQQFCNSNPDKKLIVWAHHIDVIEGVHKAISELIINADYLHGGTNKAKRQNIIDEFVEGDTQVIVLSMLAAGVGLTLHANGKCSDCIFAEHPWRPGDLTQSEDRIYRLNQPNAVMCYNAIAVDTIDETMVNTLVNKADVFAKVLDSKEQYTEKHILQDLFKSFEKIKGRN